MFASGWKERKIERAFTREDKGIGMVSSDKKLIAVIGATGQQGGGVVRALQDRGQFRVRALTRHKARISSSPRTLRKAPKVQAPLMIHLAGLDDRVHRSAWPGSRRCARPTSA